MPRPPPTEKQLQHRAFMTKALASAPKTLSPQEKMRWAATAWRRQSKDNGVGGVHHPTLTGIVKPTIKQKGGIIRSKKTTIRSAADIPTNQTGIIGQPPNDPAINEQQDIVEKLRDRIADLQTNLDEDFMNPKQRQNTKEQLESALSHLAQSQAFLHYLLEQNNNANISRPSTFANSYVHPSLTGNGILGTLVKAAPHIIKAVKIGSQIGSKIIGDRNKKATDVLDILGGLGIHGPSGQKRKQAQSKARSAKLAKMRRKQKIK